MKTLYLGLELPDHLQEKNVVHFPIIQIIPKPVNDLNIINAFHHFEAYTHLIFTSKNAVNQFFNLAQAFEITKQLICSKTIISIGKRTAAKLNQHSVDVNLVAKEETAEGLIQELKPSELKNSHVFLPQSSLSRPVICQWLQHHKISHTACAIYDTLPNIFEPLPDLNQFNQIIFTSPSTVDAFLLAYGSLPKNITLMSIGPITENYLKKMTTKSPNSHFA